MTRLIDADALLEAIGKNSIIAYHKNIVDQCEAYIKKYQSMTGFGYEVDQANKRLRLHTQYMDGIKDLITNAHTVQREGWVSVPIDEMVNRFLSWKLPSDFSPDCGIEFDADKYANHKFEPIGTNLFNAQQAKAMIEYILAGAHVELNAPTVQREHKYCGRKIDLAYGSTNCGSDFHGSIMKCDDCASEPTVQREGWVSVPIEPTEEMLKAGCEAGLDFKTLMDDAPYSTDLAVYKAMLSAAPKE